MNLTTKSTKMKLEKLIIAFVLVLGVSCSKNDPIIPNEEELITTLTYTLTPTDGGDDVVLIYKDLDAEGTSFDAEITNGSLEANKTYSGVITLSNESEDPAENMTEEVEEEANDHQFFFIDIPTGFTISYDDSDSDGNPIGLSTIVETKDTYVGGDLTIILKHEPNKFAEDITIYDATNAGGETDIEVTFEMN
ncbi:type 1 periplasmic binding fold superfamily protein [Wenyingzhuangia sp. 1_MG-2023]|nr:type 1 periplasmic binding fold superfamily protein [Wenyingzhuangia sp. 1_MG-2023]